MLPQNQLFVPFCAGELPALSMPLRFCHRLQGGAGEEITFATLSAQRNRQELLLSLACFETFPNPEDRFLIEFGEAEGGLSLSFSCSQAVTKELFRTTVFSAAAIAGRNVRILHQMTQPADHPINIYHPEGEYLKGLVLYVE